MSQQLQITGGAKVRDLNDVIIGTSGVLSSLAFNVANGVPKLDSNGKILVSQLPNSVMEYQGTWNASTNTPTLVNGVGNQGDVYLCNVAGTTNFGAGPITFAVGDSAIYSGTIWQRAGGATGTVTSVGLSTSGNAFTIGSSPVTTSGTITINGSGNSGQYINGAGNLTTFPTLISSIGLSMPSAFSVSNSPLTANGTIAVTGAGYPSQYIRGDGTLADFPTSGGGGSSVSYYLNGGTSQGTIGGVTYYEMSKTADTGTGVDFSLVGNGLIVSFLTDAGDPAQLNIPAGNWNYEIYASMSSNGGTPQMYAELYVYNGTTFTLISTSSNEILYDGVNLNLYTFAMTVPATTLTLTDRLAVKLYATNSGGKTTTVHTQDSHLCQIITTFSTGITALNGLTAQVQYFATGTSGTDFNISSTTATHTFNIPSASATNRGLITTGTQTIAGDKTFEGETTSITSSYFNLDGIGGAVGNMLNIKQYSSNTTRGVGYSSIGAIDKTKFIFYLGNTTAFNSRQFYLDGVNLTVNTPRTYTLPDASGTLALTSNLSSYVPYTGATATVNLGTNALSAGAITSEAGYAFKILSAGTLFQNGYSVISSLTGNISFTQAISAGLLKAFSFDISAWANNSSYTYILPAANGTLALTSDLGSYLPLSGGTLTGTLNSNSLIYTSLNFKTDSSVAFKNMTSGGTAPSSLAGYSQLFFDNYQLSIRKADNQSINIRYPNSALTQTWDFNVEGFIAVQYNASQTTGGVSFVRSTGQFTQDATKFFWDDTNKRLGIGTASPSYTLDVYAASGYAARLNGATYGGLILANGGTANSYIVGESTLLSIEHTTAINLRTNNADRVRITSAGNVGIGTSSPSYKLEVYAGSNDGIRINALDIPTLFFSTQGGTVKNWGLAHTNLAAGDFGIYQSNSNGGNPITAGTARLYFTSGGNVLIGDTTTTNYRLLISTPDSGTSNWGIGIFNSAGSTLMRIRNDGAFLTGNASLSPYNNTTSASVNAVISSDGSLLRYFASSQRFKEEIKDWDANGLDIVLALKPKTFKYKKDYYDKADVDFLGLIAEEVAEVSPYLADYENEDRTGQVENVRYANIIVPLIKAIQEQQIQIQSLQEQINILAK